MAPPKASSPLPKSPTKDDADDPTVADQDTADPVLRASTSPQKKPQSDYHRFFLPFSLPTNASMAQLDVYSRTEEELQMIQDRLDSLQPVAEHDSPSTLLLDWMDTFKNSYAVAQTASKFIPDIAVKEIIIRLHGSSGNPIDLTEKELAFVNETPFEMLKSVPMKYIHFEQDVRPPYFGTYTRPMPGGNARRLSRNPFARALREADYDYDSEAEWEEPEEGEDIGSDGEEDGESNEGEDDMEGFLDDEDDVQRAKRAMVTKELEPDCSGLCWQDNKGIMRCADGSDAQNSFQGYSLGILLGEGVNLWWY